MCGICGFLNLKGQGGGDRQEILSRMNSSIRHRGPDEEGFYLDQNIALGMRRLKIIDLKTGSQPVYNEDKSICVVFNGEIYNFLQLREDLENKKHKFYTHCDTEVIAHLYEEYAQDFLRYLNGMFAIAIWDQKNKSLILARDRLGKKPLHYAVFDSKLVFASEIKAILEYPGFKREVDRLSLVKYLAYEFVPAPHSIFSGIKKILPGHYLIIKEDRIEEVRYWDIDFDKVSDLSEAEAVSEFKDLLGLAVKRRLVSDVPLGVFLSGGIDSSSIVALMTSFSSRPVKTFSIGFKDASFDELRYSRRIAALFHTEHKEQVLEARQMLDLIPRITEFLDEPLADASIIPTYLLSRITSEDITVALGGDGADELFAGYPTYQAHRLIRYYRNIPSWIRKIIIENIIRRLPVSFDNISLDFKLKKFISGLSYPDHIRHYIWMGSFSPQETAELIGPQLNCGFRENDIFSELQFYSDRVKGNDPVAEAMYLDLKLYLQDDILVKVDRASMACSLEVRAPFLDYELVEFVASLPTELKLKGMQSKYLLKKAMRVVLPSDILYRPKKGFGIPVAKWLAGELRPLVFDMLSEERIRKQGFFNPVYVSRLLNEHLAKKKDHRKKIWTLFIFQLWAQRYL
jgi:asparagine synthase (glutamine-hydrolysing)